MYVVRRTLPHDSVSFKTYDGWVKVEKDVALDLSDVQRFTKGEAARNVLPTYQEWVWFGCYRWLEL